MSIQAADLRADVSVTGVVQAAAGLETVDQSLRKVAVGQGATAATSDKLGASLGGLGGQVKAVAAGFVAFKSVKFLEGAVSDAAQVNQEVKTAKSLFGQSAAAAVDFSEKAASGLGLSKHATLEMADSLGVMLKGFGLASPAAADMSQNLIKVAVDTAAFKHADPSAVLAAFQKGLGGASKGLRQYGIDASASAQSEAALSLGISGTSKQWTAAQRAAVFYQLILKGTAQATGTFAARSGDLSQQQKILSAEFANAKDELGQGLLPTATKVFSVFTAGFDAIGPGGVKMVTQIGAISAVAATALAGGEALTKVFDSVSTAFNTTTVTGAQVVLQADEITTAMGSEAVAARAAATSNAFLAESGGFVGLQARGAAVSLEAEALAAESSAAATTAAGVAATGASGGFQLMSLKAAGAIPIYTALAVGAYYLGRTLADTAAISTKAGLDISGSAEKLAASLLSGVASAGQAKEALGGLTAATEKWFQAQGAGAEQTGGTIIKQLGLSYQDVTLAVVAGQPEIEKYVAGLHLSEVNAGTLTNGLTRLHDALDQSAEGTIRHLQATGALNPKLADMAIKMSTAKDGTVDWLGALNLVANKQRDVAAASGDLLVKLDTQRLKWNDLTQAIRENTDRLRDNRDGLLGVQGQSISAEQNLFRIAEAQKTYNDAVAKSGKFSAEAIQAGLAYQALTNSQAVSIDSAAASAEKAAASQSGLTAALKVQADAIKKNDPEAIAKANDLVATKTELFRSVLTKYAGTLHGPVHDAVIQYLANTANLISGTTAQAHAVELNIKKSSGLSDALKNQAFILKIVGKDSDAYAAATATVTEKQGKFRAALVEAANSAAGPVRDKILEYIRTIDSINERKVTEVAIAGLPVAEQNVARWLVRLGFVPKDKITKVTVEASEALHQLGLLKAAVAAVNPNVSFVAVNRANAGGRASGGYVAPGATVDVGEVGREKLTMFPGGGGYVTSNADLSRSGQLAPQRVTPSASTAAPQHVHYHTLTIGEIRAVDDADIIRRLHHEQRKAELLAAVG